MCRYVPPSARGLPAGPERDKKLDHACVTVRLVLMMIDDDGHADLVIAIDEDLWVMVMFMVMTGGHGLGDGHGHSDAMIVSMMS